MQVQPVDHPPYWMPGFWVRPSSAAERGPPADVWPTSTSAWTRGISIPFDAASATTVRPARAQGSREDDYCYLPRWRRHNEAREEDRPELSMAQFISFLVTERKTGALSGASILRLPSVSRWAEIRKQLETASSPGDEHHRRYGWHVTSSRGALAYMYYDDPGLMHDIMRSGHFYKAPSTACSRMLISITSYLEDMRSRTPAHRPEPSRSHAPVLQGVVAASCRTASRRHRRFDGKRPILTCSSNRVSLFFPLEDCGKHGAARDSGRSMAQTRSVGRHRQARALEGKPRSSTS